MEYNRGEKVLTFTLEDALISPIGMAILTGAGLINTKSEENKVHIHTTVLQVIDAKNGTIDISDALDEGDVICADAPLFVLETEGDGSLTGKIFNVGSVTNNTLTVTDKTAYGKTVMVDCYIIKNEATVQEVQIDAANFAGYYYVEGQTYFRKQENGKDMPAYLTIPNVKIQSNFTFTMAPTGDPSTFTFTMDAFPGYTYFNKTKKVLCVIQIVDETKAPKPDRKSVMSHMDDEVIDINDNLEDDNIADIEDSYVVSPVKVADLEFTTGTYNAVEDVVNVAKDGQIESVALKSSYTQPKGVTVEVVEGTGLNWNTTGTYYIEIKYTKGTSVTKKKIAVKVKVSEV